MKIAICDDDRIAREYIVSLIRKQQSGVEIVTFETGEDMIKAKESFDIAFLDIKMKEISGIDVAKYVRDEQERRDRKKSIIIFVTGYKEYMEEAFDVNAFYYLLKPIDEKKFHTVFERALKEVSMKTKQEKLSVIIRYKGIQKRVFLKDIYYIESDNKKRME